MDTQNQHLDTLQDIKKIMERSSRFISLSGLSGVAAGTCALIGAWFAYGVIIKHGGDADNLRYTYKNDISLEHAVSIKDYMGNRLFQIAALTFIGALVLSFFFTYLRSKKTNTPLWGKVAQRLSWNVSIPLVVGGIFLLKLIEYGVVGLIAPGCLIFYGLALLNGSKYTLGEIKYLGYGQLILGLINLCYTGYGLYFWALGFGVLHIVYGVIMWSRYERD